MRHQVGELIPVRAAPEHGRVRAALTQDEQRQREHDADDHAGQYAEQQDADEGRGGEGEVGAAHAIEALQARQ